MKTGFFTPDREPALSLDVRGPDGARSFDAIIDTGFTGELTLPPAWIEDLGLPQSGVEQMIVADGRVIDTPMYDAYLIHDDDVHEVSVAETPTIPLLGTDFLWGFSLFVEFEDSGAIEIDSLSPTSP